ncbi:Uu.00g101290.m01.CDS01 [Anthostomella pinea]|uniref:Uu.00g101290.m01.CDS01 n=1 Tax=Anthostomella pinea TaxID=933095 RepID=A0AAI8VD07_9PEZI|nr:Uu.00g101290.m01.CDS01 [Anthostomella pinea]
MASEDIFGDVFNLEEQYYQEGYDQGFKDGAEAGRIEGCSVGLKSGFEKFLEAGRLQSKALVWANRIPNLQQQQHETTTPTAITEAQADNNQTGSNEDTSEENAARLLPPINSNPRLEKNLTTLYALVEPGTLSTENDDEAVNDFDSRLKGAQGKLKMIERALGEGPAGRGPASRQPVSSQKNENIEDVGRIPQQKKAAGAND